VVNNINQEIFATVNQLLEINNINKISINQLKIEKKIGEGGQAKVYKGDYLGATVAIKVLAEIDLKCLAHEIVILGNLNHPNIPKFYGMVLEQDFIAIVIQYIFGKTLDKFNFSSFDHKQKVKILKCICSALYYVHSVKFIHRDLKPENILIEENSMNVYLIDFGIAKVITDQNYTLTRAKGTVYYLAPENFDIEELSDDQEIICYVTTKVDVWAFGCITSFLFSSILPWTNRYKDSSVVIQDLLMKKTAFPIPDSIKDTEIKRIIQLSTNTDYKKRATMQDLKSIIDKIDI